MSNYNQYALLIGVGQRPDDDPSLAVTVADATSMYDKLTGTCGFAKEHVVLQTRDETSANKIINQIELLINQTKNEKADLVLVFFSGHGYTKDDNYYLIQYDTDKNNIEKTAINGELFINKINQINTNRLLLLLDCCHAGGFAEQNKTLVPFKEENFIQNTNRVIITSSEKSEKSYTAEPVSVFTYALIEALHGKDLRNDINRINVFDLALYVRERTRALTKCAQNPGFNVLPKTFTENFVVVDYAGNKPVGRAFDTAFKLYKDGKEINEDDIAKDSSEGKDGEFRTIWCEKLKIKEAEIGFVSVKNAEIEKAIVKNVIFENAKVEGFKIVDESKKEIIANELIPLKISIKKDRVVYGWKKNINGLIKDEETQVIYTDADLHLSVSNFFIQWAKATQNYDETNETNFQILGKLLSRFIDLENQLTANLKLSETLLLEEGKNVRIGVMLEINDDAGVLCNLPWEYLFISEKDKGSVTGKIADDRKKYPSFFLSADKNLQFQFVRQTKPVPVEQGSYKEFSILVFNNTNLSEQDAEKRIGYMADGVKIKVIPHGFFTSENDFTAIFLKYIQQMIQVGDITENYVLHYIGEARMENKRPQIVIQTKDNGNVFIDGDKFAAIFEVEKTANHVPRLIFLDADGSAKTEENNNSIALRLSYNNIPAVLGFRDEFPEDAKSSFIKNFYYNIAKGMDVAQATTIARQLLKFSESEPAHPKRLYMFGIPVLFISTKIPVKLVNYNTVNDKLKDAGTIDQSSVKKCPVCGKIFPIERIVCDVHRNVRLEESRQGSGHFAEAQTHSTTSGSNKHASGSRSDSESLSANRNNS